MRRVIAPLALVVLIAAVGCASTPSPAQQARSQIHFGWKVAKKGLWREAHFRFAQAARLAPDDARVHTDLAVSLEALGDFAAAFDEYKKAVSLAPNDQQIHYNYSKFAEFYTSYTKTLGKTPHAP